MRVVRLTLRAWITAGVFAPLAIALAALFGAAAGLSGTLAYDIAWTASALAALVGTLAARVRADPANRGRWTLWTAAAGSWLFGQIAWDVFGFTGFPASPNIADLGWWGFALLAMASMARLPRRARLARIVVALELLSLVIAALALCVGELWSTTVHSQLALAPKVSALLYPGLYVSAAILMLHATLGGLLRGLRTLSTTLVLAGIAAQALAFFLWSNQLLRGTYAPGTTLLDPLWVVGLAAIALGGLRAFARPEQAAPREEPSQLGVVLPAGTFGVLCAALLLARVRGAITGVTTMLELGLLCSGVALVLRSMLLARHTRVMLDRERAALSVLADREAELGRLNEQLREDSRRDPLTGIGNRRALSEDLGAFEAMASERGVPIAVALCDVDHFKSYNDRLGHLAGDQALRTIAATTRAAIRAIDSVYRFGGEELLLVMRAVTPDEALKVVECVRVAVRRAALVHPEGEGGVLTISAGVAWGDGDLDALLARADGALYEAKRAGRDRVIAARRGAPAAISERLGPQDDQGPTPRHLRSSLAVSRAAAAGRGPMPVLEALAKAIRSELSFQVVAVNLVDPDTAALRVVLVLGDADARVALLDTTGPLHEWEELLEAGDSIHGAVWLAAGSYEWETEAPVWTPPGLASIGTDAWHPEDMLLLPLRGAAGELIAVVSVDQPLLGRRPTVSELAVLMAVADHAGLALAQLQRQDALAQHQSDELRLAAMMVLAETVDLRDQRTARHAWTVGKLARDTAAELGLGEDRAERIHAAGVLHDLGKIGIADAILQKRGALDEAEWREMKSHPEVGARILEHAGMNDIAGWVRSHHERLDGRGYPAGTAGHAIPLEARILTVADAFEAMTADRPYRAGMPPATAREELRLCAGTQFDPVVVDAFLEALDARGQTPAPEATLVPAGM